MLTASLGSSSYVIRRVRPALYAGMTTMTFASDFTSAKNARPVPTMGGSGTQALARGRRTGRLAQSYTAGVTRIVSGPGVADNASGMRDLFDLTAEQRQVRDLVRALARERVAPLAAQVDETETYPTDQLTSLGEQGLMGLYIPEAYGGAGLGAAAFCLAVEEIAWACASTAVIYLVQYTGGVPIRPASSETQKRRYLPRRPAGESTPALSLSEPGARAHARAPTTAARRRGGPPPLHRAKMWG